MASIKFRIKGTKNTPTSIYARLYYSQSVNVEVKTGFEVYKKDWSETKESVKNTTNSSSYFDKVNGGLIELKKFFNDEINRMQVEKSVVTKEWLKDLVSRCFNQPKGDATSDKTLFFVPFVEYFIELSKTKIRKKNGKTLSKRTIQDYQGTLKKIIRFEKEIWKRPIRHSDITFDFHDKFIAFCTNVYKIRAKTIGGEIDNIKLFCRKARMLGIEVCSDFESRDFFSPDNETNDIALTEKEMEDIFEVELLQSEKLDNARDWFVIGLWTGLRVGDLLDLSKQDINDGFIEITNKKTGIPVVIPVHENVQSILDKRGGFFPRKISSQKFNDYIKDVAELAGLTDIVKGGKMIENEIIGESNKPKKVYRKKDGEYKKYELVSSHICRRSFATFHYGKLDTLTIMNITGHTTEKQFLEYVKITPRQHAEAMKKMWNKYYKNV